MLPNEPIKKMRSKKLIFVGIFFALLSQFGFAHEQIPLDCIGEYNLDEPVKLPKQVSQQKFTLKEPFLGFENGVIHINPKTRKISAVELTYPLAIATSKLPEIPSTELGGRSAKGEDERLAKEFAHKERQSTAAENIFTKAYEELSENYFLKTQSPRRGISRKCNAHSGKHPCKTRFTCGCSHASKLINGGYTCRVHKRSTEKQACETCRIIKESEIFFGPYGPCRFNNNLHADHFDDKFKADSCRYGKLCSRHTFSLYDRNPSERSARPIRRVYFCIAQQQLKVVIENVNSGNI